MAEAHSAATIPVVKNFEQTEDNINDVFHAWRLSICRRLCRTRISIKNGMWPTSIYNLAFTVVLANFLLLMDYPWAKPITRLLWQFEDYIAFIKDFPYFLRLFVLTCCFGLFFFVVLMYIRRYALRILLSYRGWLYEKPHSQSYKTIFWALIVRMISGYSPSLYSYQCSLPKMPVPPLRQTLKKLMDSLKPLYGANSPKMKELIKQSKEFERTLGFKLQKILILKSWLSQNYVTDWWEKYIYLMGRSSLLINSNYYALDHVYHQVTPLQCARAGMVMHLMARFTKRIYREKMNPLVIRNTIPLCMSQYEKMFSTSRIPNHELDEIRHFDHQRHIVVYRKGIFYQLNLMDKRGRVFCASFLQQQFEWIINDADRNGEENSPANDLCSLTGFDRISWARIRNKHFSSGVNKANLDLIESSLAFVSLEDTGSFKLSDRGFIGLCGEHIWADKTISFLFLDNGKISVNAEHSWADAPVIGHLLEYIYTEEVKLPRNLYDEYGHCVDATGCLVVRDKSEPTRLNWNIDSDLADSIKSAKLFCKENAENVDLVVLDFNGFGKGFIKSCRVSPDAFIQMALQLAYYKLHGKFALTYESSMTRLYLCGRTETVRSLTQETADFVLSMVAESVDRGLKIRLFRRSCDMHQFLYREAMAGNGIDRHLFALFILSKGLGYDCEFLKEVLSSPWTLSTSQQPQQQINNAVCCDLPEYRDCVGVGGGFGPVSESGYGVSYMIAGDFRFFFHVSSNKLSTETDSSKFGDMIFKSLYEIKALFDGPQEH